MSKNSSNSSTEGGNNISPSRAKECKKTVQISPAVAWCFTFNNYDNEIVPKFQSSIKEMCKVGFFNKEVGESGTPHLQGYIELKKKGRPINMFPKGCHWAKAKGNQDANFKYCSKDAIEGNMTFCHGVKIKPKVKIIEELRPFQKSLENMLLSDVDEGKIIWVYDPKGQLGKTEFLRYMYIKYSMPFTYGGKTSDIVNLVFNHKEYLLENDKAVMIYNFGRDTDPLHISYKSMEQISDGCISNTKFETGCFVCNKPHVLVLANCLPLEGKFSAGRLKLFSVNDELELVNFKRESIIEMNDSDDDDCDWVYH